MHLFGEIAEGGTGLAQLVKHCPWVLHFNVKSPPFGKLDEYSHREPVKFSLTYSVVLSCRKAVDVVAVEVPRHLGSIHQSD